MEIAVTDHADMKVLTIDGEIDMHSSPALRKEMMGLVGIRTRVVLVDFSSVSYIDSSGIATFVEGLKGMKSYGGRLKFHSIPEGIAEIFSFSKLDRVFEIYTSLDAALDSAGTS